MDTIEAHLKTIYTEMKKEFPGLTRLTFELSKYSYQSHIELNGFYHVDEKCTSYDNITELQEALDKRNRRRETLFQNFDHVL